MGTMYKDICYESTFDAAQSVKSNLLWKGYSILGVWDGMIEGEIIIEYDLDGVSTFDNLVAPTCTYTGLANFMGVGLDDAVEASWLVALTLIAAWSILVIKRTL